MPERHKVALMADRNLIFHSPVRREKRSGMGISMRQKKERRNETDEKIGYCIRNFGCTGNDS